MQLRTQPRARLQPARGVVPIKFEDVDQWLFATLERSLGLTQDADSRALLP